MDQDIEGDCGMQEPGAGSSHHHKAGSSLSQSDLAQACGARDSGVPGVEEIRDGCCPARKAAAAPEDDIFSSGTGDSDDVVVEEIDTHLYPNHLLPDMFLPQTDLYLECSEEGSLDSLPSSMDPTHILVGQNVPLDLSVPLESSSFNLTEQNLKSQVECFTSRRECEVTSSEATILVGESCSAYSQPVNLQSGCLLTSSKRGHNHVIKNDSYAVEVQKKTRGNLKISRNVEQSTWNQPVPASGSRQNAGASGKKEDGIFVCSVCEKEWPSAAKLKRHLLSHNSHQFPCLEAGCSRVFKHRPALQDHQRVVHRKNQSMLRARPSEAVQKKSENSAAQSKFLCPWPGCGKSFRDGFNLRIHHCLHTGDTPLSCSLCSYRCVQKASLNWHMKKMHS